MRILVTGGAGFQGSHLCEALLARGHRVTVLNTFSLTGKQNLSHIAANDQADVVFGSVTDWELVSMARDHSVIFHLAANVNVDKSLSDPRSFVGTNVIGSQNVLEAARQYGARVILASTCEVYGDGHHLRPGTLLDESAELKPNSPYAASKAAADRLAYSDHRSYGMDITIVRPFNIFGERQKSGDYGALIAILVRRALKGEDLVVFGDGSATRDYLHVSDLVQAYGLVLDTPELAGSAINFASGTNTRVRDIADYIADRLGTKVVNGPARPGEVTRFPASIERAQSIGFVPRVEIWEGIDRYIDWARQQPPEPGL